MADPEACRWCGQPRSAAHGLGLICPFVKAIEFDPSGHVVTRVEFVVPADLGQPARAEPAPEPEPDYPRKQPMRES